MAGPFTIQVSLYCGLTLNFGWLQCCTWYSHVAHTCTGQELHVLLTTLVLKGENSFQDAACAACKSTEVLVSGTLLMDRRKPQGTAASLSNRRSSLSVWLGHGSGWSLPIPLAAISKVRYTIQSWAQCSFQLHPACPQECATQVPHALYKPCHPVRR